MPHLSVLIPAHNAAATLGRAVRSVLPGLPKDSQVVIVNDGSSDHTGVVAEQLASKYPKVTVFHRSHPSGVAGALNFLLANTDSHVVARMDADDVSLPLRIPAQLRRLRQADVIFTPMATYGSQLADWRPQRPGTWDHNLISLLLTVTNPLSHPTVVAQRSWFDAVGGYRKVPAEDYDLWLRMALAGARLHRVAIPAYAYRQHGNQVTASTSWREASWQNPELAQAFEQHTQQVLGRPFQRLTSAAISPWSSASAFEDYLASFNAAYVRALDKLSGPSARYALQVAEGRINHARKVFRARGLES